MPLGTPKGATLFEFNPALAASVGLINPLSAQLDALLSVGLGPFQAQLSASLNASLAASATFSLQIGDPLAALNLAISALVQIQASLQLALQFPPIQLSLSAELSASAALAASLSTQLGLLNLAIQAALQVKLGAVKLAAQISANLSAGPVFAFTFDGDTLSVTGGQIQGLFAGGLVDGVITIDPGEVVSGVVLLTKVPSVSAALSAIITV